MIPMVLVLASALLQFIATKLKDPTTAELNQDTRMNPPIPTDTPSWHIPSSRTARNPIRKALSTACELAKDLTIGVAASAAAPSYSANRRL